MAAAVQRNKPGLHRKEWETMAPVPTATAAGAFVVCDSSNVDKLALVVSNASTQYLYHHDEDAFVDMPSGALAGTFGPGACGGRMRWSNTVTATGGTTTTATTTANINGLAVGKRIRFISGANTGLETVCTGVIINPGGTSTLKFGAVTNAVANADTFMVETGLFLVMNAGTIAANIFKSYDPLTGVWTALTTTGLPAAWGTDGRMVVTPSSDGVFATISAPDIFSSTTVGKTGKTWTANQWTNSQVRIVSGLGVNQLPRTIASNTATTLTVSSAWSVTPDATSVLEITGNDDYAYLLGNNAITMYRYSRAGNSWSTLAPTTARIGAPVAGMSADWCGKTGDPDWANESDIKDGRYIFSFKGGGAGIDRFDIAGGTAGAGAWLNIVYPGLSTGIVFGAGSGFNAFGRYIYCRLNTTNRFFKFSMRGNYLEPLSTNLFGESGGLVGSKIWVWSYTDDTGNAGTLNWLYSLQNSGQILHRLPLY